MRLHPARPTSTTTSTTTDSEPYLSALARPPVGHGGVSPCVVRKSANGLRNLGGDSALIRPTDPFDRWLDEGVNGMGRAAL